MAVLIRHQSALSVSFYLLIKYCLNIYGEWCHARSCEYDLYGWPEAVSKRNVEWQTDVSRHFGLGIMKMQEHGIVLNFFSFSIPQKRVC